MEELLEKISPEKRWAITAKNIWRFLVLRGAKTILPLLSKDEGVYAPVWGWEKWGEINTKVFGDQARKLYLKIKETFNIPIEDAVGASKLSYAVERLVVGPEIEGKIVEATPERAVYKTFKCTLWDIYDEQEIHSELRVGCHGGHEVWYKKGLMTLNPKLTCKFTKAMGKGDPYCEIIIEFKDA